MTAGGEPGPGGPAQVSLRTEIAVYGVGAFSSTMYFMAVTIVPLWVVGLDLSPFVLGIVLGSRPALSLFLSIHIGALMDKAGGRRMMLFFAIVGTLTPLLYPLMPWVWAVIALQILWGLADSMGWLGAQTLVGQLMQGRTVYAGRRGGCPGADKAWMDRSPGTQSRRLCFNLPPAGLAHGGDYRGDRNDGAPRQ